jgi:predicted lipoprotein with Yx(FWY)xxD motif
MRKKLATAFLLAGALTVPAAAPASPTHAKVLLRSTSLGKVLVDTRGRTLYLFEADKAGKSSCYAQCAAAWPPYLTAAAPLAGPGLKQGLLRTTKRSDGKLQVVFAGHPLYRFSGDAKAGQVEGEGIEQFGGSWYAVGVAGKKVERASPGGTTTTTPGYGGYGP